jgi:hypothetical protein
LNVKDVYVTISQNTAAVPEFPKNAELLSDKFAGVMDNIKDHSVYTYVCTETSHVITGTYENTSL